MAVEFYGDMKIEWITNLGRMYSTLDEYDIEDDCGTVEEVEISSSFNRGDVLLGFRDCFELKYQYIKRLVGNRKIKVYIMDVKLTRKGIPIYGLNFISKDTSIIFLFNPGIINGITLKEEIMKTFFHELHHIWVERKRDKIIKEIGEVSQSKFNSLEEMVGDLVYDLIKEMDDETPKEFEERLLKIWKALKEGLTIRKVYDIIKNGKVD